MAHDLGIITKMVLYVLVDSNSTFFYSNIINLMRLNDFFYYFLIRHDCTLKSKKLVKWLNDIVWMINSIVAFPGSRIDKLTSIDNE